MADGGVIRDGYHAELDELRSLSKNSKTYLAAVETRERERTGIGSLKVRFNRVFGYYIEISKSIFTWFLRTTTESRRWWGQNASSHPS